MQEIHAWRTAAPWLLLALAVAVMPACATSTAAPAVEPVAPLHTTSSAATRAAAPPSAAMPSVTPPAAASPAAATRAVAALAAAAPAAAAEARGAVAAGSGSRFDLAVSDAPAAQVYMQLASGTAFNVLVSPEVTGTISITLKDTTLTEALDSLRELFGYDFRISGNRVFVYPNTVQTRLYRVNYLPGRRQGATDLRVTSGSITNTSNGGVNGSGGGTVGSTTSSRPDDAAHVRTTSDADFWREVQASLAAMVGSAGGRGVVLNPSAGVVVVKATPNEQRQVEQYLRAIQLAIERQVMIEAKIIEVTLSKDSQAGVNWAAFGRLNGDRVGYTLGSVAPGTVLRTEGSLLGSGVATEVASSVVTTALGGGFYGLALQASNFAAMLNFLQSQGDVSVLSSPRIATLNNQKAVLKVGTDEMFVTGVSTTTTSSGLGSISTPTLTLQPFFSGIALDVTPQIDEKGNVILHMHPSITKVTEKNKLIDLGDLGEFRLPLASSSMSQTDNIVRVKDGQIVAIGGLMTQQSSNDRSGVPVLQDTPLVGGLFRQSSDTMTKRELVILMKPTVIRDDEPWPGAADPVPAAPARP